MTVSRGHDGGTTIADPSDPSDREPLRARYRLPSATSACGPDGNDQYIEPTGRFAHFLDDPYAEPVERAPRRPTR